MSINMNKLNKSFRELLKAIGKMWNELEQFFNEFNLIREQIESERKLRKTWHVPQSTIKNHQVLSRKPLFVNARNQL